VLKIFSCHKNKSLMHELTLINTKKTDEKQIFVNTAER